MSNCINSSKVYCKSFTTFTIYDNSLSINSSKVYCKFQSISHTEKETPGLIVAKCIVNQDVIDLKVAGLEY